MIDEDRPNRLDAPTQPAAEAKGNELLELIESNGWRVAGVEPDLDVTEYGPGIDKEHTTLSLQIDVVCQSDATSDVSPEETARIVDEMD